MIQTGTCGVRACARARVHTHAVSFQQRRCCCCCCCWFRYFITCAVTSSHGIHLERMFLVTNAPFVLSLRMTNVSLVEEMKEFKKHKQKKQNSSASVA